MKEWFSETRLCLQCGSPFRLHIHPGPQSKYCSDRCRRDHDNWLKTHFDEYETARTIYDKVCEHCGAEFRHYREDQRYCSPECGHLSARTLKGTLRDCVICGAEYEPHNKDQSCCSKPCQMKASQKVLYTKTVEKVCERCGSKYDMTVNAHNSKYCTACKDELYGSNGPQNRARKWGVEYEPINNVEVFARDHWACGICGERVDRRVKYPDPMSASVDHIVPISCGGGHVWSNVQCSHLGCNSSKYNKSENSQLRLELSA